MERATRLDVEQMQEEPYASILCYPRPSESELAERTKELKGLGVTALELAGTKQILGIPVLGKECVGIVTIARCRGVRVALKIRRIDADRLGMLDEAKLLK